MKTANSFNSCLAPDIKRYISLKQALGRRFEQASWILLKSSGMGLANIANFPGKLCGP
jgi:hypothetical protein